MNKKMFFLVEVQPFFLAALPFSQKQKLGVWTDMDRSKVGLYPNLESNLKRNLSNPGTCNSFVF